MTVNQVHNGFDPATVEAAALALYVHRGHGVDNDDWATEEDGWREAYRSLVRAGYGAAQEPDYSDSQKASAAAYAMFQVERITTSERRLWDELEPSERAGYSDEAELVLEVFGGQS